jgi:hypothetical protein
MVEVRVSTTVRLALEQLRRPAAQRVHAKAGVDHDVFVRSPQMPDVAPKERVHVGLGDKTHPVVDASGLIPLGGDRKRSRGDYSGL